jgi:hypothetical protein
VDFFLVIKEVPGRNYESRAQDNFPEKCFKYNTFRPVNGALSPAFI